MCSTKIQLATVSFVVRNVRDLRVPRCVPSYIIRFHVLWGKYVGFVHTFHPDNSSPVFTGRGSCVLSIRYNLSSGDSSSIFLAQVSSRFSPIEMHADVWNWIGLRIFCLLSTIIFEQSRNFPDDTSWQFAKHYLDRILICMCARI